MRRPWVWFLQRHLPFLLILAALAAAGGGCNAGREVLISTTPADATLTIDDVETARAPATQKFHFANGETHKVLASRFGYSDQEQTLALDPQTGNVTTTYHDLDGRQWEKTVGDELQIALEPKRKQITINVTPVPAFVSLDGALLSTGPVSQVTRRVNFTVDAQRRWVPHTVTVSHPGFKDVSRSVEWTDPDPAIYDVALQPRRKDLRITSRPPGAEIFVNGESRGAEPVTLRDFAFPVDPVTGQSRPQKITARKPGFDPVDLTIEWEDGKTDYVIQLGDKTKTVHIRTDPPGGVVKLDGTELRRDASGVSTATRSFSPTDDMGTPRAYAGIASKKEGNREWEAAPFRIGWDNGQRDYSVPMTEVKTRTVSLVRPRFLYGAGSWQVTAETVPTTAPRDTAEPGGAVAAGLAGATLTPVFRLPAADDSGNAAGHASGTIDTLATSPDASQIVFAVVRIGPDRQPHSQLHVLGLDAGPGSVPGNATPRAPRPLGDDKGLSLYPSFSPDGKRVLFSSNGDSKRMGIWSVPADGSAAPVRVTTGETTDLWPTLDSLPQPRLFYESLLDGRGEPRLYVARPGSGEAATDLSQTGSQPHVSPAADTVLFDASAGAAPAGVSPRRHLFTIPDAGGRAVELNHTADFDDFDPCWSKDGSQIAFASNRPRTATGAKGADGKGAASAGVYNIWLTDPAHPDAPARQITFDAAWNDCPAWDATGKAIYFRSNRGGSWGIWKLSWK